MTQQLVLWQQPNTVVAIGSRLRIVYFLESRGRIKIGFTTRDIRERIAELATGNPDPIELIGTIAVADDEDDRDLHRRFAVYNDRGEWFHATPELCQQIATLLRKRGDPTASIEVPIDCSGIPINGDVGFVVDWACPGCGQRQCKCFMLKGAGPLVRSQLARCFCTPAGFESPEDLRIAEVTSRAGFRVSQYGCGLLYEIKFLLSRKGED